MKYSFSVNGRTHQIDADPDKPLLYALRNDIGLNNPRFGCGLAQCGACSVIVDGQVVRSCAMPVSAFAGKSIRTLEGLGTPDKPHPVQAAFAAEQVPFCGYCINGWILTATAMLEQNPRRTDAEIRAELAGLKCRCGSHMALLRAVRRAAKSMA